MSAKAPAESIASERVCVVKFAAVIEFVDDVEDADDEETVEDDAVDVGINELY